MEMQAMTSTQRVLRLLRAEVPDAEIKFTGGGHIKMTLPNGKSVFVSASPSDEYFFMRTVKADIKRALRGGDNDQ
jgi:uncharacterized protein (DUF849 family)